MKFKVILTSLRYGYVYDLSNQVLRCIHVYRVEHQMIYDIASCCVVASYFESKCLNFLGATMRNSHMFAYRPSKGCRDSALVEYLKSISYLTIDSRTLYIGQDEFSKLSRYNHFLSWPTEPIHYNLLLFDIILNHMKGIFRNYCMTNYSVKWRGWTCDNTCVKIRSVSFKNLFHWFVI